MAPLSKCDQQGLDKKLLEDGAGRRPKALRTPISRVRSRTATIMTFITPRPPRKSVTMPDGPQKILHAIGHLAKSLGFLHRVPDRTGFLVMGIEVVQSSQYGLDFALCRPRAGPPIGE